MGECTGAGSSKMHPLQIHALQSFLYKWSPQLDSENCKPVQVLEKKNDASEKTINRCDPCPTTGSFKT